MRDKIQLEILACGSCCLRMVVVVVNLDTKLSRVSEGVAVRGGIMQYNMLEIQ